MLGSRLDIPQCRTAAFTGDEVKPVIGKIFQALDEGGRFAFRVKQGNAEGWTSEKLGAPRYFKDWQGSQMRAIIEATGFKKSDMWIDVEPGDRSWLQVILEK